MSYQPTLRKIPVVVLPCIFAFFAILLSATPGFAQFATASQQPDMPWSQDLKNYPGLLEEFGRLFEKFQHNIQFPGPRSESRLLPLLPQSTMSYAAFPNYGDVARQALKTFRQELQESAVLRDWWAHGALAAAGPKVENSFEKLDQLYQFLGDELVVSGALEKKDPNLLIVAEVRKSGLKNFLQQTIDELAVKSKPPVRVLDMQELAAADDKTHPQELLVLVRPDFVVVASDLATLRSFNARLDHANREFTSAPFGQRILREYQSGVTVLSAADIHTLLNLLPPPARQDQSFQHSGYADMKYLVWDHKEANGQSISQAELSFNAPRHGLASSLAPPGPLGSLDFVSPNAIVAGTVVFNNPPQIFDELKEIAASGNPAPFAVLTKLEQAFKFNLRDDVLSNLNGELTLELDSIAPPPPAWKVIFAVSDANRLQQTLTALLAAVHFDVERSERDGVSYSTFRIPAGKPIEIAYAFAAGYLIFGSSQSVVADAAHLHASGESLGKSKKLLAALPPGHTLNASGLLYEDPVAMAALRLQQFAPEMAASLVPSSKGSSPSVMCVYGEETAIREASRGGAFDVGAAMIVAAVAIPNLLRSRMAANEASAVGSVRTVNVAQITYSMTFPKRGFAPNLASLGPDPRGPNAQSPDHGGFIDNTLANENCTADAWCTKSGFHFRVTAVCKQRHCSEFVTLATPVASSTGTRSFCSTSDGIIRYKFGPPLTAPIAASECRSWPPLQ